LGQIKKKGSKYIFNLKKTTAYRQRVQRYHGVRKNSSRVSSSTGRRKGTEALGGKIGMMGGGGVNGRKYKVTLWGQKSASGQDFKKGD